MKQQNIEIVFRKKGKLYANAKAAAALLLLNEPELTRFFSAANQNEIAALFRREKTAMRRYRDAKAHDYVVEDFSDECASRLYLMSETVYRPSEAEVKSRLLSLFALTPTHLRQIKEGPVLWKGTFLYWADYAAQCWEELFGFKADFLPSV